MAQETPHETGTTRRAMLAGTGLAGVAAALAACSSSSSSGTTAASTPAGTTATAPAAGGTPASGSASSAAAAGGGSVLGEASAVPAGGGKVFSAAKVVVTQPAAGQFKAFSAVCTHQQCIVDQVADGTINCPCHGSKFSIKDGSVVAGPAPSPLPAQQVTVTGGQIELA